jgi:prefoldin subunit 5
MTTEKIGNIFKSEIARFIGQLALVALVGYFSVQKSFSDAVVSLDKRVTVVEISVTDHLSSYEPDMLRQSKDTRVMVDRNSERLIKIETQNQYMDEALKGLTSEIVKLRIAVAELNILIKKK